MSTFIQRLLTAQQAGFGCGSTRHAQSWLHLLREAAASLTCGFTTASSSVSLPKDKEYGLSLEARPSRANPHDVVRREIRECKPFSAVVDSL